MTNMPSKRLLNPPQDSFFLIGPRATGKSTWLENQIKADLIIDLLKARDFQKYSTHLSLLREVVEGNPKYKTIVIDEIQKLPELLDEVHSLIFDSKGKIQFILTGSSARKLKKQNVNLLAGRALLRHFHPFSLLEIEDKFNLTHALQFGMLPHVWNLIDIEDKKDYLVSYVDLYLKEEIKQEAAVRSLPSYISFLEHFALRNGQVINIQNLSQEIGVPRTTLIGYLDILEQTLLGFKLAPIQLKAKVKEVATPKFYFFDTGVSRALAKKIDDPISPEDKGFLLETYLLHELKTYSDYYNQRWDFFYWGTPSENEVDFIVTKGQNKIGIEVKSTTKWNSKFNAGLNVLLESKKIKKAYGVYLGSEILKSESTMVYPVKDFVKKIFNGELF